MADHDDIIRPDSFDPDGPQHFATEEEAAKFAKLFGCGGYASP